MRIRSAAMMLAAVWLLLSAGSALGAPSLRPTPQVPLPAVSAPGGGPSAPARPQSPLPRTGLPLVALAGLGAALLGVGLALRRRLLVLPLRQ